MMSNRPVLGVMLALIVEAAHWSRFQWDFNDETCARAWQFTSIGIGLATFLIWLEGDRYTALPNLLTWLPALLVPMQFVQAYGSRASLPLNTFSFLAKRRHHRNLRLGLTETPMNVNFGNIYFLSIIVAATLGSRANVNNGYFLSGIVLLIGWRLVCNSGSRPFALVLSLMVAAAIAVAGQVGLQRAQDWLSSGMGGGDPKFNPNSAGTLIGKVGTIKQSSEIVWRLRAQDGTVTPRLLRTATYNNYRVTTWENQRLAAADFKDLDTREASEGGAYFILKEGGDLQAIDSSLPRFTLRGGAEAETPLPLPGDAASVKDFPLDGIEGNTFGCIRVFPKSSVIEGTVLWRGATNPEAAPIPAEDLRIPISEQRELSKIAHEIGLVKDPLYQRKKRFNAAWTNSARVKPEPLIAPIRLPRIIGGPGDRTSAVPHQTLDEKLSLMRAWFFSNFKYSRTLTIASSSYVSTSPSAIARFLTKERVGHCEYFASAATLLLREAGVPARYATGYAVAEYDRKHQECVIRGTHGHAWSRVWDEQAGLWKDFDVTPPVWIGQATPPQSATQGFNDGLKRLREDFFLWRNRPANRLAVSLVMGTIALGVISFLVKRLWRSKRRLESSNNANGFIGPAVRTPLHGLEPHARKRLGYRQPGQTFAEWLAMLRPSLADAALLDEAIDLHQRLRFDPAPAHPAETERLTELTRELAEAIKRPA